MADFTIKQNDTWPPMIATLSNEDGPIPLGAAASVKLIMKSPAFTVTGDCEIVDAPAGTVNYEWAVGDLANVGVYNAEFEITWNTGKVETVPNDRYLSVEVVDDLG